MRSDSIDFLKIANVFDVSPWTGSHNFLLISFGKWCDFVNSNVFLGFFLKFMYISFKCSNVLVSRNRKSQCSFVPIPFSEHWIVNSSIDDFNNFSKSFSIFEKNMDSLFSGGIPIRKINVKKMWWFSFTLLLWQCNLTVHVSLFIFKFLNLCCDSENIYVGFDEK